VADVRRRLAAFGAALLLTAAAGCGVVTAPPQDDAGQVDTGAGSDDGSEGGGESPGNQVPRVSVAGLPIGGETFVFVGDAWCGVATLSQTPPPGAEVTLGQIGAVGGRVDASVSCGAPSCVEPTRPLSDRNNSCSLAVRPDDPDSPTVLITFTADVTCETEQDCSAYRTQVDDYLAGQETGAQWTMRRPTGSSAPDSTSGTESPDTGTSGEGGASTSEPDTGDGKSAGGSGDGGSP
jgi:hypothetical protein